MAKWLQARAVEAATDDTRLTQSADLQESIDSLLIYIIVFSIAIFMYVANYCSYIYTDPILFKHSVHHIYCRRWSCVNTDHVL